MNFNIHANKAADIIHRPRNIGNSIATTYLLPMRLSLVLMIAFSMDVTASAIAQKIDIQAKNEPLKNVLQEMSKQSGYAFLYKDRDFHNAKPVTISLKAKELFKALQLILADQPFSYQVNGKIISIIPKRNTSPLPVAVNQQTVGGRVTDSIGNPLQGVTVQVKESGWQTITD